MNLNGYICKILPIREKIKPRGKTFEKKNKKKKSKMKTLERENKTKQTKKINNKNIREKNIIISDEILILSNYRIFPLINLFSINYNTNSEYRKWLDIGFNGHWKQWAKKREFRIVLLFFVVRTRGVRERETDRQRGKRNRCSCVSNETPTHTCLFVWVERETWTTFALVWTVRIYTCVTAISIVG